MIRNQDCLSSLTKHDNKVLVDYYNMVITKKLIKKTYEVYLVHWLH